MVTVRGNHNPTNPTNATTKGQQCPQHPEPSKSLLTFNDSKPARARRGVEYVCENNCTKGTIEV